MPLVVDQLQLWTVGFKWAGLDPTRVWFRLPEPVRDNFSTLLEAILQDELACLSLSPEKYKGDDAEIARFHIRYWIEPIYAAIQGSGFDRRLLKHAVVEREAFREWCERRTIPLPEFWFPTGWTAFRWDLEEDAPTPSPPENQLEHGQQRNVVRFRTACQVIAEAIWKEDPGKTIADMVTDERIQRYGGAHHYGHDAVRRWVKAVAPAAVSQKRGRPRKKNLAADSATSALPDEAFEGE